MSVLIGDTPAARAERGTATCLELLAAAVEPATLLGLDVGEAEAVAAEAADRLRHPGDAYVVALVGGTGVGKSSLLNALAGTAVSEVSARRPTTARPIAWLPAASTETLAPLVDRLGVVERRLHDGTEFGEVVVLDLPDIDSLDGEHVARVEELLPRLDAVVWVTDHEKYHDAALHDRFLRRWLPRLDRQLVVVNKADRLTTADADRVRHDLERDVAAFARGGRVAVVAASARSAPGVEEVATWLRAGVDARRIVLARIGAAARAALDDLGAAAHLDPTRPPVPLLDPPARAGAVDGTVREALALVDLPGAERRAVAATRAAARRRGTGPMGVVTSLVYRLSGRERRAADPGAYLGSWRARGWSGRPTEPVRQALAAAVLAAPPAVRPAVASVAEPEGLAHRLGAAVDRGIAAAGDPTPPTSRLWSLLGLLQTVNTVLLVGAVAWLVVWILARPPVESVDLPLLGPVPMPLALLAAALVVGFVLARLVGLHAGLVGRRWARRLRAGVESGVRDALARDAFGGLDRIEAARRELWRLARDAAERCRAG